MAHPPNKLENARVVVFGGTSGLGFATASLVLSLNARVTIIGSNPTRIESSLERLRSFYPHIAASQVDGQVVDLSKADNLEEKLIETFDKMTENGAQKIDHIVFTAGNTLQFPPLKDITLDDFYRHTNVRINGVVLIGKLLTTGKWVKTESTSSFTLTGGVNTAKPSPGWSIPAAWGGLAEGFMRALAVDLRPIRVNTVAPGAILTELFDTLPPGAKERLLENVPKATLVGKVGEPHDTAEAYVYLMKDKYITGKVLGTDGGYLLASSSF